MESHSAEIFFKSSTVYEITLCPPDSNQYWHKPLRDILFNTFHHKNLMDILDESCFYSLFPEISEGRSYNHLSSPPGRIHYHGIIKLKNVQKFLLLTQSRLAKSYQTQINEYRPDYWYMYSQKQWLINEQTHLKRQRNISWRQIFTSEA